MWVRFPQAKHLIFNKNNKKKFRVLRLRKTSFILMYLFVYVCEILTVASTFFTTALILCVPVRNIDCSSFLRCPSIVKSLPETKPNATFGINITSMLLLACVPLANADVLTRFAPAIRSTFASVII